VPSLNDGDCLVAKKLNTAVNARRSHKLPRPFAMP